MEDTTMSDDGRVEEASEVPNMDWIKTVQEHLEKDATAQVDTRLGKTMSTIANAVGRLYIHTTPREDVGALDAEPPLGLPVDGGAVGKASALEEKMRRIKADRTIGDYFGVYDVEVTRLTFSSRTSYTVTGQVGAVEAWQAAFYAEYATQGYGSHMARQSPAANGVTREYWRYNSSD